MCTVVKFTPQGFEEFKKEFQLKMLAEVDTISKKFQTASDTLSSRIKTEQDNFQTSIKQSRADYRKELADIYDPKKLKTTVRLNDTTFYILVLAFCILLIFAVVVVTANHYLLHEPKITTIATYCAILLALITSLILWLHYHHRH